MQGFKIFAVSNFFRPKILKVTKFLIDKNINIVGYKIALPKFVSG